MMKLSLSDDFFFFLPVFCHLVVFFFSPLTAMTVCFLTGRKSQFTKTSFSCYSHVSTLLIRKTLHLSYNQGGIFKRA